MSGLREIVAAPGDGGRVFAGAARAGLGDCAPGGRARLDAISCWMQDVAFSDVEAAGLAETAVWVVRWARVRVERFPRFGESLSLRTWCSGVGRMWAERRTSVIGANGGSVEAVSLWVHLDPTTRMPSRFTTEEMALYGVGPAGERAVSARLRHPGPDGALSDRVWRFRASERDLAEHVNNAAYWRVLEEELLPPDGARELEAIDVEIEFRAAAQPGEVRVLSAGDRRWLVAAAAEGEGDGEVLASIWVASSSPGLTELGREP